MDLDHALVTTRAVRKRLDLERPVERSVVEECLRLALQAPNGSNRQLYHWVLIDDPHVKAAAADIYRAGLAERYSLRGDEKPDVAAMRITSSVRYLAERMHQVPILVVPLIRGEMVGAGLFEQASRWGTVLPAVWSLMLALRGRGLGSAWTTVHLVKADEMAKLLGIPPGWTQAGLFPIAYTKGTEFKPAARRPVEELSSWNRFVAKH